MEYIALSSSKYTRTLGRTLLVMSRSRAPHIHTHTHKHINIYVQVTKPCFKYQSRAPCAHISFTHTYIDEYIHTGNKSMLQIYAYTHKHIHTYR